MRRIRKEKLNMVFISGTITEEAILERGKIHFKNKNLKRIKEFEELIESNGKEYGKLMLDIDEFLSEKDFKIPVYIESDGTVKTSDRKYLSIFINNIDDIEFFIRERILKILNTDKDEIYDEFDRRYTKKYSEILKNIIYDTDSIDYICSLAYVIIEGNYMGIGIATYWSDTFIEFPLIENGKRVPLNEGTRINNRFNGVYLNTIDEVTTFRDLESRPDLGMIKTHGRVRSFFSEKDVHFPIWLLRSYEVSEIQEQRFQEFQKNYSYYSNLIASSLVKYFGINYPNIIRDCSAMKEYGRNTITSKQMKNLCRLSRIEIFNDGSTYVIINSDWGEDITIQIWNKDIKLTNYFALPIVGSKYGPI